MIKRICQHFLVQQLKEIYTGINFVILHCFIPSSFLYRISGLSNKFIYFNDDIFLGAPTYLEDFYSPNKGYLIYLANSVPNCAPNCSWLYVSDGQCDKDCNVFECQMDGNDCTDVSIRNKLLGK